MIDPASGQLETLVLELCGQAGTTRRFCPPRLRALGGGDSLAWRDFIGLFDGHWRAAVSAA